ncbi:zinc finger protein 436-like isoform X3 [Alosa alosa]|uniref:zinc finger protein 436-like isoform X3 n=1 Tax=Alosa alosa TaxID=278164 RepID=UPI002015523E|nr:zinc finger protein 436-like isoform X3 [Alosa alosa]
MDHGLSYSSGGNVTDTQDDLLRVIVKEEDIKEEDYGHMTAFQHDEEKPFVEPHCKTETDIIEKDVEDVSTCTETQQTTAEVKVKKEEEEEELDYVLGGASEYPHGTQQKIHGQNDELHLQLEGRLHHCTICRKSFPVLTELNKHQQTHSVDVNEKQKSHQCEKLYGSNISSAAHAYTHGR